MSGNGSAIVRLMKELDELKKDPIPDMSVGPRGEDILHWEGVLNGPIDTPYFGGFFKFTIDFRESYPMRPPIVRFATKIYHPNIDPDFGIICIDILRDNWTPTYTVKSIMLSVISLLSDPNPDHGMNSESARLYRTNREQYNREVEKWVRRYAVNNI